MAYVNIQPVAIKRTSGSGKAYLLLDGTWVPKFHVHTQGSFVVAVNDWILRDKPSIARRVLNVQPAPFVPAPVVPYVPKPYVPKVVDPSLVIGAYRLDGEIFVVRKSKVNRFGKRDLFALQMVTINGERLMLDDTVQRVNFIKSQAARTALYTLKLADRLTQIEEEAITIRYGRCLNCGRGLKDATSVAVAIGPICYENLYGIKPSERKKLVAARRVETARAHMINAMRSEG